MVSVRRLQGGQDRGDVPGPLEVLLPPEGPQRNAPKLEKSSTAKNPVFAKFVGSKRKRKGPAVSAAAAESKDTGKIAAMLEMGETVTKKCNKIVDKFQTSESNLAKQQCYRLQNQRLLMKEIRRLRKSSKKDTKNARNALTRVMQHLQTFADNIENDKDVSHNQTTRFFGPLTKAGKNDSSLGSDGAKAVFATAKEIIVKHTAEGDDNDDDEEEMTINGLIPMSDAEIM